MNAFKSILLTFSVALFSTSSYTETFADLCAQGQENPESSLGKTIFALEYITRKQQCDLLAEDLAGRSEISFRQIALSDLRPFSFIPHLESLWLKAEGNFFHELNSISNLTELRSLGLSSEVTIADLDFAKDLLRLEKLDLNVKFYNISLKYLSKLSSLHTLNVYRSQDGWITARVTGWQYLPKSLETLVLHGIANENLRGIEHLANLSNLDISGNSLSDLEALSGLKNLRSLSLEGNQINYLSALYELKNLKFIRLAGNLVSKTDIDELRDHLPNTQISWHEN